MKVLFVYKWCTMGGVERAILNRAIALRPSLRSAKLFVHFVAENSDTDAFRRAVAYYRLENLAVIDKEALRPPAEFDICVSIDTPEMFSLLDTRLTRCIVECHTTYAENQNYLRRLPSEVREIVVPSGALKREVESLNISDLPPVRILHNFVPPHQPIPIMPRFRNPLLVYIGRLDRWKNPDELWMIMRSIRSQFGEMRFLVASPQAADIRTLLREHGILDSTILLPAISFERVPMLLSLLHANRAVFVSCSRGESFGLAAAEALGAGLPALLSDVPGHRYLVQGKNEFLYQLGDIEAAINSLRYLTENWDEMTHTAQCLARPYQDKARFLDEWNAIYGG